MLKTYKSSTKIIFQCSNNKTKYTSNFTSILFTCNNKTTMYKEKQNKDTRSDQNLAHKTNCADCNKPAAKLYYQNHGPLCIDCYNVIFHNNYSNHY